ncbi:MAG: flippase [Euryarchaeota archaeon]|nr:flippase [Euryarchaeota archaeon]MBU4032158.1 flippase [Candidatus Thermoplasmatota archaeon]MBU4072294.1 flippase [Candidatus Thermoplasmatota archaeon]MBU4143858.1 flippase [Candidatus Thermoplasmatota archaeon]
MIARNSFIIMVSQAASAIFGMLALTIVSKLWGGYAPSIMGIIWFAMAFVGTFSFITNMGFDVTHIKKVSEGRDMGTCMGTFISIKLILIGILITSVLGSIAFWKYFMSEGFYDATTETVIYIFLGYSVFFALGQIAVSTFNSRKENVKSQISLLMDPIVRSALVIIVALAGISGAIVTYGGATTAIDLQPRYNWPGFLEPLQTFLATHTVGAMAIAYLLGAFAMFCMAFFLLRKYPVAKPTKNYLKMYFLFATPLMIPIIFTLITANIDKVMIGYFWSAVEVGYYSSVQRISAMILMISASIGIVVYPTISAIHARKNMDKRKKIREIAKVARDSERYASMVTIPVLAMIIVFAVPIIDIVLNSSFRPATMSFQLLTIYAYVFTIGVPYTYLIVGMNRPKQTAKIVVLAGIANIVLNFLLIPHNGLLSQFGISGINGAACSILASIIIMLVGLHYYSNRITGKRLFQGKILLHMIAGVVMGMVMWGISTFIEIIRWYHLGVLFFIGLGTYIGVLWCFKEFKKADLNFFLDTMNLRKLFKHVKKEMGEDPKFKQ